MSPKQAWPTLRDTVKLLHRTNGRVFVATAVTSVAQAALYPALLVIVSRLLRALLGDGARSSTTAVIVALSLVLAVQVGLLVLNDSLTAILRADSVFRVTSTVLRRLARVPYSSFEDNQFQARYGTVVREAAFRIGALVEALVATLVSLIAFLGVTGALLFVQPLLVLLFALVLALGAVEVVFGSRTVDLQTSAAPELLRMQFLAQMSIDSTWQRDLRVYESTTLEEEYRSLGQGYIQRLQRLIRRFGAFRLGAGLGGAAALVAAVALVLHLVDTGAVSEGDAALLLPGLYFGLHQGRALASSAGHLTESLAYAERLNRFVGGHDPVGVEAPAPAPPPVEQPATPVGPAPVHRIDLDGVSFAYPTAARPALEDVTLSLRRGVTAIVGPNGAGKSTLVKILAGLLEPVSGSITMVDRDGRPAPLRGLRRAVLFQEPSHLFLTVLQNVTMRPDADPDDRAGVVQALEASGLWSVVEQLPQGLDTVLGSGFGGMTDLSGGQWQRLALARLLYHESPLIVLDEPVASLDPEGEQRTFDLLRELAHSRIVVFTTHRYDSIRSSDNVVVLVDGRVVEVGTHAELLRQERQYSALYAGGLRPR